MEITYISTSNIMYIVTGCFRWKLCSCQCTLRLLLLCVIIAVALHILSTVSPAANQVKQRVLRRIVAHKLTDKPTRSTLVSISTISTVHFDQLSNKTNLKNIQSAKVLRHNVESCTYNNTPWEQLHTFDKSHDHVNYSALSYAEVLHQRAIDATVILSLVDFGSLHMALNFWETSLVPYRIANYLFITLDTASCSILYSKNIPCYVYTHDEDAKQASVYNTKAFARKMYIRTLMILNALHLGYKVLHSDIDIIFFDNPLNDIHCNKLTCDIAPLWDYTGHNAGFVFIQPTNNSIRLYETMKKIGPLTMDQAAFNKGIDQLGKNIRVQDLDIKKYECGKSYWEIGQRTFAGDNPCDECLVVHNNWIISIEAKTYRFREMHLWQFDGEEHYYTDNCRKYLTYENVAIDSRINMEMDALKNALAIGHILNRTVIIPKFHFGRDQKESSIINGIKLRKFQAKFPNFREHTFLSHPKVPTDVKISRSEIYQIRSAFADAHISHTSLDNNNLVFLKPANYRSGATESEIRQWFGPLQHSVLQFHSLYKAFCCFDTKMENIKFSRRVHAGFVKSNYIQS